MKKHHFKVYFILIFLISGFASITIANTLSLKKGSVKIRRDGKDLIYRTKGKTVQLQNKDMVQTSQNSLAIIELKEKKDQIILQSRSFFQVELAESGSPKISMPIGKARFKITKRKNRKRRFRVKTANAIIGVKGTDFIVATGEGSTSLLTISGIVSIANIQTPDVSIDVIKSQATQIQRNLRPTIPVALSPQVQSAIIKADSPKQAFSTVKFGALIAAPEQKKSQKKSEKTEGRKEGEKQQKDEKQDENKKATPVPTNGESEQRPLETPDPDQSSDAPLFPTDTDPDIAEPDVEEPDVEDPEIEIEEPEIEVEIPEIEIEEPDVEEEIDKTIKIKIAH